MITFAETWWELDEVELTADDREIGRQRPLVEGKSTVLAAHEQPPILTAFVVTLMLSTVSFRYLVPPSTHRR